MAKEKKNEIQIAIEDHGLFPEKCAEEYSTNCRLLCLLNTYIFQNSYIIVAYGENLKVL